MKALFNRLINGKNRNDLKNILLRSASIFTLFAFLFYLIGCGNYFKVREKEITNPETQAELNLKGKYVIIHYMGKTKHLSNIQIEDETISGFVDGVSPEHMNHLFTSKKGGNKYKIKIEPDVIDEVHLHLSNNLNIHEDNKVSFLFSDVQKVYFYSKDRGATAASWILPPLLAIGVIVAISAASSCPFIYTYDGGSYNLAGEIYGGATYSSLERHDYLPLPGFDATDGIYQLKLTNELKEIQYTNLIELIMVQHSANSKVLIDKRGNVQTILLPQPPRTAVTINNNDLTIAIKEKDNIVFGFDDIGTKHSVNGLILTFRNTGNAKVGKLIIKAKNSVWADYAYGTFTNLFGTYYEKWDNDQKNHSKKKLQKNALDQDIPLSVYIETKKGWKFIDYFEVVGPLAYRDIVLPIDLSKANSKEIRIKMETGFKFWELDYAAMDFTDNIPVNYSSLQLVKGIDENDKDVKRAILHDDDHYLVQPEIGNEVVLQYAAPQDEFLNKNFTNSSIILHSKGYYERIRDYQNDPDWITLIMHKHKHAFSKYSKTEYEKAMLKKGLWAGK